MVCEYCTSRGDDACNMKSNQMYLYVIIMCRTSFRVNLHCNLPECQGTPYSKQAPYVKFNDINGIRTHNYLIRKQTLNHLAKLAK